MIVTKADVYKRNLEILQPNSLMDDQVRSKTIIHLDMDAFYPSVEVLDNPGLKGKPVIVGGSKQRGVVSSASYEARKFGVHSAQPMATAMRLCPQGIFLPVRMSRYKEVSNQIFKIFHLFTPLVEPLSIDEAFLDVTDSTRLFGQPEEIAKKIKQMVVNKTGLPVSAGVAPSKFVAKIASDIDKPDGLTVVPPDRVREFLNPLPINKQTFLQDITNLGVAKKELLALAYKVARRMRLEGVAGKTITLKVRYSDFVAITRSTTLSKAIDDAFEIYSTACSLLDKTGVGKKPTRLLGISLSQLGFLGRESQFSLFQQDKTSQKRKELNTALDSICEKYGENTICPGTLFSKKANNRTWQKA